MTPPTGPANAGMPLTRRDFLRAGTTAGAGLLIAVHLPTLRRLERVAGAAPDEPPDGAAFEPNAWLRVAPDGAVTVLLHKSEMGQGASTGLAMLVAEELDADWSRVKVEFASGKPEYAAPWGMQLTGGSSSLRSSFTPLRQAGAAARAMLVSAAASAWGVAPGECRTENGEVLHDASGRRAGYGALASAAAALPVPEKPALKDPKDFRLVGKPTSRVDTREKITGKATFGIDVRVPGMLFASVERCPVFGGRVKRFEAAKALAVPGVKQVARISSGVAVIATSTWSAFQGRRALTVQWDEGPNAALGSASIRARYAKLAATPGARARHDGDPVAALAGAARVIDAVYEAPYLAHATMEPMNATAHVRPDGCDIWAPTQFQSRNRETASKLTGLPPEKIAIHTTLLGGGFGRRAEQDFVIDALEASMKAQAPVQVVWTREDDMRHDYYRPYTYNVFRAALDSDGWPVAWTHRIVAPSVGEHIFPGSVKDGVDGAAVEGAANLPYDIANVDVNVHVDDPGVPVGFWRSVGSSQNAYVTETFLDELAAAGGKDPYELRRRLLAKSPKHLRVLELAATEAGWGTPLPAGRARGIALAESFGSVAAEVAEVSLGRDGQVRVHRVTCALDCGFVVNPRGVEAQVQGAVVYGLTAALHGPITLERGRVQQSNFHDYQMLRMKDMPAVEVHLVPGDPGARLGGVGEPGTPPIAPAVANAVFALTGVPVRTLPIKVAPLAERRAKAAKKG